MSIDRSSSLCTLMIIIQVEVNGCQNSVGGGCSVFKKCCSGKDPYEIIHLTDSLI